MSTTTPNYGFIKPELTDAADITAMNENWDKLDVEISKNGQVITIGGDGAAFTATVPGITELKAGLGFTMIPNTNSTTTAPTLNVNGLGAKNIKQLTGYNTGTAVNGTVSNWLVAGKPVGVRYDGTYWIVDVPRPNANALYGTVAITNGGTGATTASDALTNLGAEKARTAIAGSGAVTVTVADYQEYAYTNVTSLTMTGAAVNAHGFVTFSTSTPTVTISGFTASAGDDIASDAAANQIWEFSVFPHNSGSYIIWKNWSA